MIRNRIDREIAALRGGVVHTLPADRALERAREVIRLADELAGDFRRVRDDFDRLNRSLRQSLVENDGSRGEVLEQLFPAQASSTYTWQVAQRAAPPHSATMPGTPAPVAAAMTLTPSGASKPCSLPSARMKVISGMVCSGECPPS